ncbi:unnamed protein product [Hermetia illucens]|uniref:MADF domain-containing protein n=2 Tax=Hermetia illucens TaxID=343691 RepID=A0A7R8Z040_HERIL|nr:unnamed protein product [Hermetia illucens]
MQRLTETQVEKLIELVKQNPSLYDKHQRQNESLDLIWERIAVDLNADEIECKTAWKSLRDQFVRTLKTLKGKIDQDYPAPYKYFKKLLFLQDVIQPKSRRRRLPLRHETSDKLFSVDLIENVGLNINEDNTSDLIDPLTLQNKPLKRARHESTSSSGSKSTAPVLNHPKKEKRSDDKESYENLLSEFLSKVSPEKPAKIDPLDSFFLGVSGMVKKFDLSPKQLIQLQCKLMNCLTEELEKTDSA